MITVTISIYIDVSHLARVLCLAGHGSADDDVHHRGQESLAYQLLRQLRAAQTTSNT